MTANDSIIVYVHGISRHHPGYSDTWHASLEHHLSQQAEKHEVLWSDIVNALSSFISGRGDDQADIGEVKCVWTNISVVLYAPLWPR